jgi:hypothetical protein
VTPSELTQHFGFTVNQLYSSGHPSGILSHIRINSHNNFSFIGIHLGLNMHRLNHLDKAFIRKKIRDYFQPTLTKKESLRCLLEVRNEPRIDIYLERTKNLLSSTPSNSSARQLIELWCRKDGLSLA